MTGEVTSFDLIHGILNVSQISTSKFYKIIGSNIELKNQPFLYAKKTTKNLFPEKSGDDPESEENSEDYHENDAEFWRENDRKIEARLAARKKRLENYCENIYPAELDHSMHDWKHKTRHFYVGDGPHKFLGCVPLKVGTTAP